MSPHSISLSSNNGQLAKRRRTICGAMERGDSYCFTIVTTSFTTKRHKNHESEAPRVVPCHAQNLTTHGSGRVVRNELFLVDCEKRACDAVTVLIIFAKHLCRALTSSPLPSSDIPAFDAHQHVSGSEIFDSSARSNKWARNGWPSLGRARQVLAPPQISACAQLLLPNCAVIAHVLLWWGVIGKLCWNSCASFGSLSCASSAADSSCFPPRHPE